MKTPASARMKEGRSLVAFAFVTLVLIVAQPFLWNFVRLSAKQLHSKRTETEQYANLTIRVEEMNKQNEEQRATLADLTTSFPRAQDLASLVERIESAGTRTGIAATIESINEGDPAALYRQGDTGVVPLTITVHSEGTPGQLFEYMQSLEHVPEVTTIDSWTLDPIRQAGTSATHRLVMNITFYLQK